MNIYWINNYRFVCILYNYCFFELDVFSSLLLFFFNVNSIVFVFVKDVIDIWMISLSFGGSGIIFFKRL